MQITAELMEEFRQDMIAEDWRDAQHEKEIRNNWDYFSDMMLDKYSNTLRELFEDFNDAGWAEGLNDWIEDIK